MIFYDYTLSITDGAIHSERRHNSDKLVKNAVAVFVRLLERGNGDHRFDIEGLEHIRLLWTHDQADQCALATFFAHETPLATSLLLTAYSNEEEAIDTFTKFVARLGGGFPAMALRQATKRPAILSAVLPQLGYLSELQMVADMETCLAAAYFTRGAK